MTEKSMNLSLRGSASAACTPNVELWLENGSRGRITLRAKHAESDFDWVLLEIFDDFTFTRASGMKGPFPTNKIMER